LVLAKTRKCEITPQKKSLAGCLKGRKAQGRWGGKKVGNRITLTGSNPICQGKVKQERVNQPRKPAEKEARKESGEGKEKIFKRVWGPASLPIPWGKKKEKGGYRV